MPAVGRRPAYMLVNKKDGVCVSLSATKLSVGSIFIKQEDYLWIQHYWCIGLEKEEQAVLKQEDYLRTLYILNHLTMEYW